jgi:acyl-CoA thioester hydrolase
MSADLPQVELRLKVEFYDVDSMKIVWHGNYARYLEQARCALLDSIGYGYERMEASGYAWPVVNMQLKYVRPLRFGQQFVIRATLLEYENRIRIRYLMLDPGSGGKINSAETIQMAVDARTGESLMVSPACLVESIAAYHRRRNA